MSEPLPNPLGDAELISRTREGDSAAYGLLYERHIASARSLARHLVQKEAEADDVVAETFTKVLDLLKRGGGPDEGFRPYVLTAVRRTAYDRFRGDRRQVTTGEIEAYDPGEEFVDPALAGLERSMIVKAFRSLPERWRTVLWHTIVEREKPAAVAPLLGLSANSAAALAYRAREGLRQAYLQMHLRETTDEVCRPVLDNLGAYVRGGLAKRENAAVEAHLDECARCKGIYAEIADVNGTLRTALGPLVLGAAATAYLGGGGFGGIVAWWNGLPKWQQQALGGGTAAAAAAAVLAAFLLTGNEHHTKPRKARPAAAAPAPKPPGPKPPAPNPPKPHPHPPNSAPPAKPKPHPKPKPPVPAPKPAKLVPAIAPVGTLLRDQPGIVGMSVRNAGQGRSGDLLADVKLPPGVTFAGGSAGRNAVSFKPLAQPGGGWSCRPVAASVRCTHAPIRPGESTSAYLRVLVGGTAPYGKRPLVSLRSGTLVVTATSEAGVRSGGFPARFATDGNVATSVGGNALLSCDPHRYGCAQARQRHGDRLDDDFWWMRPLDLDSDAATHSSSSARVGFHGKVLWAGLYWSGVPGHGDPSEVKLRGPGAGAYANVRAVETDQVRLPSFTAYQSFADVTSLVRTHGAGEWWAADAAAQLGVGRYAGWSLVVVTHDDAAPLRQVMVLDGAQVLGPDGMGRFAVPIEGLLPSAVPADLNVIAWEGDACLAGDRLSLQGRSLGSDNVFHSASQGAIGPALTFGTDVRRFSATLGRRQSLTFVSDRDAYLAGAITVTSPMRS